MFHFPHKLQSVEKPVGQNAVGALIYEQHSNNVRCQFLGRPREGIQHGTFGESKATIDAVFSIPIGIPVDVGWRIVYNNIGYLVEEVEPMMDASGRELNRTVFVRREQILDGALNYTQTT